MKKIIFIYSFFSEISDKKLKNKFWLMVTLSLFSTVIISVQPLLMSKIINTLEQHTETFKNTIILLAISYILIISLRRLSSAINFILLVGVRNEVVTALSKKYFRNIFNDKNSKKENENVGDITQRLNQSGEEISTLLKNVASNFIPPIIQLLFSIILIIASGDYIVASLFIVYFFLYLLTKKAFNPKIIKFYNDFYSTSVKRYSLLTDSIKNIDIARNCNSFDYLFLRYKNYLKLLEEKHKSLLTHDAKFLGIESVLSVIFFGSAFIYTLYRVVNGEVSLGHFVMIASYILLLSGPLETIGTMFTAILKSTASVYDFLLNLDEKCQSPQPCRKIKFAGNDDKITVDNISFSYTNGVDFSLKNVSLKLKSASFTTITGKSGSGKSTLTKLISGNTLPSEGFIYLNGVNLNSYSENELSSMIYYLNQDEFIFMDTLRFNLLIACPTASDNQLLEAIRLANLYDLFKSEEGKIDLDLKIGDDGETLSGGQKQRLSIARLFLRTPEIIILDEATSALDLANEKLVIQNIIDNFPSALIINISHRPSTFYFSDSIVLIDNGRVISHGSIDYLSEKSEYFKEIIKGNALKQVI